MLIDFTFPCYNEEQLLRKNCLKFLDYLEKQNYSFDWRIILIINGSSDNSEKIALELEKHNPKIKTFIIKEKGRGNAIKTYFDYSEANFLVYMDIDMAVSMENTSDLINPFLKEDYDINIGSRLLKSSKTERSFIRELSSRTYILLSKTIIGHRISDLQCGFKGIKKEAWKKLNPFIEDKTWFFDTELLLWASILNLKIKEIPVNWSENRYEKRKSKVKLFKDSLDFSKKLLKLRKKIKKTNI
ncbi:MAG: glycosyltransferase [Patescibacteria group bacterium]|nr:glycosyltransferase [Patescibacteria group bacterium]